jgi:hypothetical protein
MLEHYVQLQVIFCLPNGGTAHKFSHNNRGVYENLNPHNFFKLRHKSAY